MWMLTVGNPSSNSKLYVAALGIERRAKHSHSANCCRQRSNRSLQHIVFAVPKDKEKLDEVLKNLTSTACRRKMNGIISYVFRTRMRQQGESFDNFLRDLKIKPQTCHFNDLSLDSMMRSHSFWNSRQDYSREITERNSICKTVWISAHYLQPSASTG